MAIHAHPDAWGTDAPAVAWRGRRGGLLRQLPPCAAAAMVGLMALLVGRATPVEAQITCQVGIACDGRCCTDGYECVGDAPNRICAPPCTGTEGRCGTGCCGGVCLQASFGAHCCAGGATLCEGSLSLCCPVGYHCLTSACDDKKYCIADCPANFTGCGETNCCAPGFTCESSPSDCGGRCLPFQCPVGTAKCGEATCCTIGQSCEEGRCVDPPCPIGSISCGNVCCGAGDLCADPGVGVCCSQGNTYCAATKACVLACQPGETWNPVTCTCECAGTRCGAACCTGDQTCCNGACCQPGFRCEDGSCVEHCARDRMPCGRTCCPPDQRCDNGVCRGCPRGRTACGTICCPAGKECSSLGGLTKPKCCPKGKSCGVRCQSKRTRCCEPGFDGFACGPKQICCGEGCCSRAKEQCVDGACVPK